MDLQAPDSDKVGRRKTTGWSVIGPEEVEMRRNVIGAGKALLRDESGQTMLEYVVIVVFVVIVMFIAFRMIGPMIHRNVTRASRSIEQ